MDYPILLYRGENFNSSFYYYLKFDVDHAFLLIEKNKKTLFVPKLNEKLAKSKFSNVVIYKKIEDIIKHIKYRKIFFDASSFSTKLYILFSKLFKMEDISDKLFSARAKKKEEEIATIAKAVKITKKLFAKIDFDELTTENDVRTFLLHETLKRGLSPAFEPIVATGKNSSMPHYHSSTTKISDYVLVDYGVRYKNYCADLTRCFFLKKDRIKEEAYLTLKNIFNDLIDEFPNFSKGSHVTEFSAKLFSKYKMPEQIHAIGHGLGLDVHEFPRLGLKSKDSLVNSVLAIEPGVYYNSFGARFEENIYFDGKKVRIF